jgi:hypothetical protein
MDLAEDALPVARPCVMNRPNWRWIGKNCRFYRDCTGAEAIVQGKDIAAEGPLPDSAGSLKNQDEVDDLLSSMGF